jgi:hypothetical protein
VAPEIKSLAYLTDIAPAIAETERKAQNAARALVIAEMEPLTPTVVPAELAAWAVVGMLDGPEIPFGMEEQEALARTVLMVKMEAWPAEESQGITAAPRPIAAATAQVVPGVA